MTTVRRATSRIVLGCSGDLATSVAIPWLAERYGGEVVALTLDLGQGEPLDDVRERALGAGAVRAHVIDVREEFARDFILPALQSGALEDGREFVAVGLARLVVAKHLVAAAALEEAGAVAHGASDAEAGERFGRLVRSLNPRLRVMAPAREWRLSRAAQIAYAESSDIPVLEPERRPIAFSSNLLGRLAWRAEGDGSLGPAAPRARRAPAVPASVVLRVEAGAPVAINDVELPLVDLITSLATIAGAHGVGRLDGAATVPDRGRLAVDIPAATVLGAAYRALRGVVLPARTARALGDVAAEQARIIAAGRWFTPERTAIDAALSAVRARLSGDVRLELSQGACRLVACGGTSTVPADEFVPSVTGEGTTPARA
jgi:argininosuccinate synthase